MSEEDIKESIRDLKKSITSIEKYVIEGIEVRADMSSNLAHLENKFNSHIDHVESLFNSYGDRLTATEKFQIKWEGFKWAWALMFTAMGAGALSFIKWIGGFITHG